MKGCFDQKVYITMNAIGIASQYEASWTEAMQLCSNDICSQQCVEAVAAVPYMFANEAALTMSNGSPNTSTTSTNLMIFYLGGTGGISPSQADWLRGHSSTLAPIYLYLVSRDTELDCGYKSASGIAGRIARAYIDDLVTTTSGSLGSIDDFACTIEDYFYCVRDDYSRAEFAFNAAMDVYDQYGSTCSMCAGALSARGSVCPCEDPCSALLSEEISSIMDAISLVCSPDSEIEATLDLAAFNACNNVNLDPVDAFYVELGNEDFIIPLFTDDRLNCIWESFNDINDDLFCSSYANFLGETTINLYLQNSIEIEALATTQSLIGSEDFPNTISIFFNQNQLDGLCEVTVSAIFLHEGIHAEMHRQLNDPSLSPNNTAEIWNRWETELNDHDNMAMSYISQIIASLKALFGDRYSDEEYEAIAWIGLGNINNEGENTSAWNALSDDKKNSLTSIFQAVNSNCENDTCID